MDRVKAVFLAFLIVSNLLIFSYGLLKYSSASVYERDIIASLNLDSAVVSAIHDCEDMTELEQERSFKLNRCETSYSIHFSDTGGFYIRASVKVKGMAYTREAVFYR